MSERVWKIDDDGDLALYVDGEHDRKWWGDDGDAAELRPILERGQAAPVSGDPLPEGVHRAKDGRLFVLPGFDLPGDWQWRDGDGAWRGPDGEVEPVDDEVCCEVRPVQQTEPVPLHKLVGRTLPGMTKPVGSFAARAEGDFVASPVAAFGDVSSLAAAMFTEWKFTLDADGMVEVLKETDR